MSLWQFTLLCWALAAVAMTGVWAFSMRVRNVGYGRSLSVRQVRVRARVIDLREEEFRQTGFRSR